MRHRVYACNALATAKLLLILLKTKFLPKKIANFYSTQGMACNKKSGYLLRKMKQIRSAFVAKVVCEGLYRLSLRRRVRKAKPMWRKVVAAVP